MKGWLAALILAFGAHGFAQTGVLPIYACTLPGTQAYLSGMSSTNYQMGIIPSCTVTVYLTGTQTIATTTPQSPFTANTDGSIQPIYASTSQGYDVVLSGGIAPNTYHQPVTLTDVFPSQSFMPVAGVTSLTPGTNVTCTPESGGSCIGNVTVNAASSSPSFAVDITQPPYNAACDGTTDDHVAIQAALDNNVAILIPATPNSTQCNLGTVGISLCSASNKFGYNAIYGQGQYFGYTGSGVAIKIPGTEYGCISAVVRDLQVDMTGSTGSPTVFELTAGDNYQLTNVGDYINGSSPLYTSLLITGNLGSSNITNYEGGGSVSLDGYDITLADSYFYNGGLTIGANGAQLITLDQDYIGGTLTFGSNAEQINGSVQVSSVSGAPQSGNININGVNESYGLLQTTAPTAYSAGINLPPGVAPASPNNGDCWTTTAGLFCQINGAAVEMGTSVTSINTSTQAVITPGYDAIGSVTPIADIRAYGAVIDGATPINTALASAQAACNAAPGNACDILIPGGGPSGKYALLGPTSTPLNSLPSGGGGAGVKLQGTLQLSSTLILNGNPIMGDCGGSDAQFANSGCTAVIIGPNVYGTTGGATTANTAAQIPLTFTEGGFSNLLVGSAITLTENVSCTGTVTLSTVSGTTNFYSITCPARTAIGPEELIQATSCTNSSFNTLSSGATIYSADWSNNGTNQSVLTWFGPTGTSGSTTCTVTGRNWDTFESVEVTGANGTGGCPTNDVCFVPAFAHPSGASWGEVAVRNPYNNYQHSELRGINIMSYAGVGLWMEGATDFTFDGLSVTGYRGSPAVGGIELSTADYGGASIDHSVFVSGPTNWGSTCGTTGTNNCSPTAFAPSILCDSTASHSPSGSGGSGCGLSIGNSVLYGETFARGTSSIPSFKNVSVERPTGAFVRYEPLTGGYLAYPATIDGSMVSDPMAATNAYLAATDDTGTMGAQVKILDAPLSEYNYPVVNKYWHMPVTADNAVESAATYSGAVPSPEMKSGGLVNHELRGEQAGLGPAVVPYPTLAVTSPGSLACNRGNCSVTAGIPFIDGSTNAVELDATATNGGAAQIGNVSGPLYVGDTLLLYTWTHYGANLGVTYQPFQTPGFGSWLKSDYNYDLELIGDMWHPVVEEMIVTAASGSGFGVYLNSPSINGQGQQYACYGMSLVPGPNNPAYTAADSAEKIEQARQQLYHGCVPSHYNSPGHAVTTEQIDAPGFNILNLSTGAVASVIPSTTTGYQGSGTSVQFGQSCTTGSIGGSALSAGGSTSGTCTLSASATGHAGEAATTDGSVQANYITQVSISGTTATVTLTAIAAGTPTAKDYNVVVF